MKNLILLVLALSLGSFAYYWWVDSSFEVITHSEPETGLPEKNWSELTPLQQSEIEQEIQSELNHMAKQEAATDQALDQNFENDNQFIAVDRFTDLSQIEMEAQFSQQDF